MSDKVGQLLHLACQGAALPLLPVSYATGHKAKWAFKIDGFVEPSPSTLEQKMHWGIWTSSVMMKSTRSPRMILD